MTLLYALLHTLLHYALLHHAILFCNLYTGCNILGAISCYDNTAFEDLLEYVWESAALKNRGSKDQTAICR